MLRPASTGLVSKSPLKSWSWSVLCLACSGSSTASGL